MSSKNSLQEFCIKNKHSAPVYDSKKIGGESHDPQWFSTVTVVLYFQGKPFGLYFQGKPFGFILVS